MRGHFFSWPRKRSFQKGFQDCKSGGESGPGGDRTLRADLSKTIESLFAVMKLKPFHDALGPFLVAGIVLGQAFKLEAGKLCGVAIGVENKHRFQVEDLFDFVSSSRGATISFTFTDGSEANAFVNGALDADGDIDITGGDWGAAWIVREKEGWLAAEFVNF